MKKRKNRKPIQPIPDLVSANRIATELNRTARAVIEKIAALGIEPDATVGEWKLYRREVIETVGAAMRAPNKAATTNHS